MTLTVLLVVLLAALLHASWNALVKSGNDKLVAILSMVLGHLPFALLILLFTPAVSTEALPYLLLSGCLHTGYSTFLLYAYRVGDFSHVYPIARGVAPLIVTLVSVLILGTVLLPGQLIGIVVIATGIVSLALVKPGAVAHHSATLLALGTGCFIAAYSLVDGLGARVAGAPFGYFAWTALINAATFIPFALYYRPQAVRAVVSGGFRRTLLIGGASFAAYSIVVWAFTQAPIALVSALRETSIVFALLIGVLWMREPLNLARLFATVVTMSGAVLVKLSR